jgi:hypothetical protein
MSTYSLLHIPTGGAAVALDMTTHGLRTWTVSQDGPFAVTFYHPSLTPTVNPFDRIVLLKDGVQVFRGYVTPRRQAWRFDTDGTTYEAKSRRWWAGHVAPLNASGHPVLYAGAGDLQDRMQEYFEAIDTHLTAMDLPGSADVAAWPTGTLLDSAEWEGTVAHGIDAILEACDSPGWHWYIDGATNQWRFYRAGGNGTLTIDDPIGYDLTESLEGRAYTLYGIKPSWAASVPAYVTLEPAWVPAWEGAWSWQKTNPYSTETAAMADPAKVFRLFRIPGGQVIPIDYSQPLELVVKEFQDDPEGYMSVEVEWADPATGQFLAKDPILQRRVSQHNWGKVALHAVGRAKPPYYVALRYMSGSVSPEQVLSTQGGTANSLYGFTGEYALRLDGNADQVATELARRHVTRRDVLVDGTVVIHGEPPAGLLLGTQVTVTAASATLGAGSCAGYSYDFLQGTTTITLSSER